MSDDRQRHEYWPFGWVSSPWVLVTLASLLAVATVVNGSPVTA